jgi:hypothetical protein
MCSTYFDFGAASLTLVAPYFSLQSEAIPQTLIYIECCPLQTDFQIGAKHAFTDFSKEAAMEPLP